MKANINHLLIPELITFTHLRIKTEQLYIQNSNYVNDEFLLDYLLPSIIKHIKREREAKTCLIMIKWLTNLNIDKLSMIEEFIEILPKIDIKDSSTYFQIKQYLEHTMKTNIKLISVAETASNILVSKYETNTVSRKILEN